MAAKKGAPNPKYNLEEKLAKAERICQLYESQQATLESCCEAEGISRTTFFLWRAEVEQIELRYKKAVEKQDANYWQDVIRPLSKRAIQKHLEAEFEEEEKEVVWQGFKPKDEEGNPIIQRTKKPVLPNPTVTIFAAKGLYPEMFVDRHEHTGKDGAALETKVVIISKHGADEGGNTP